MKHLEYDKVYETFDIIQMMRESGLIPSIDYKDICLLLRPLFNFGYLKIIALKHKHNCPYYQFVKVGELQFVNVRIRWLTGHNDVWLWEKLVDGVIVEQRINYF